MSDTEDQNLEGPRKFASQCAAVFNEALKQNRNVRWHYGVPNDGKPYCRGSNETFVQVASHLFKATEQTFFNAPPRVVFDQAIKQVLQKLPDDREVHILNSGKVWVKKEANMVEFQLWVEAAWEGYEGYAGSSSFEDPVKLACLP